MPSKSAKLFNDKLLPDVNALIKTHGDVNPAGPGKRNLGHLTRSGVVMLCAAWELYVEEVAIESAEFLTKDPETPDFLPKAVKTKLADLAKNHKHHHGALQLCGNGWKKFYIDGVRDHVSSLNTPKADKIQAIFSAWFDLTDVSKIWTSSTKSLDDFVSQRGDIAHRGASADYVTIKNLIDLKELIKGFVSDTDNGLSEHLKKISSNKKKPWRNGARAPARLRGLPVPPPTHPLDLPLTPV